MSELGKIRFPRGLQIPAADSFTTAPAGTLPPADFPDGLPFLAEYHCQYASTADMSMCCWSTVADEADAIAAHPFEYVSRLFARFPAGAQHLVAGARLLDAFRSHPAGRDWSEDSSLTSFAQLGSVWQARRGASRLLVVMCALPNKASMVAYQWREPDPGAKSPHESPPLT